MQAAGLTPDQLRAQLADAAGKFVAEPNATVVVKEIHSRKVFITGNVAKAGTYPLSGETLYLGRSRGLSNRRTAIPAVVQLTAGRLLVVETPATLSG